MSILAYIGGFGLNLNEYLVNILNRIGLIIKIKQAW